MKEDFLKVVEEYQKLGGDAWGDALIPVDEMFDKFFNDFSVSDFDDQSAKYIIYIPTHSVLCLWDRRMFFVGLKELESEKPHWVLFNIPDELIADYSKSNLPYKVILELAEFIGIKNPVIPSL